MIHRRIVGAVLPADAERDDVLDLVGERRQPLEQARGAAEREVGPDRRVAAGDVEADAHDRHLFGYAATPPIGIT